MNQRCPITKECPQPGNLQKKNAGRLVKSLLDSAYAGNSIRNGLQSLNYLHCSGFQKLQERSNRSLPLAILLVVCTVLASGATSGVNNTELTLADPIIDDYSLPSCACISCSKVTARCQPCGDFAHASKAMVYVMLSGGGSLPPRLKKHTASPNQTHMYLTVWNSLVRRRAVVALSERFGAL
eukprot:2278392-Amphidinium_carterae.2